VKTKLFFIRQAITILLRSILGSQPFTSRAQSAALSHWGRLDDGGNPVNGNYDQRFATYDSLGAGTRQGEFLTAPASTEVGACVIGAFIHLIRLKHDALLGHRVSRSLYHWLWWSPYEQ
jgi:hypothetical protein